MESIRDTTTNTVEEIAQEKQNFGFFGFFKSKKGDKTEENENKTQGNNNSNNNEINTEENEKINKTEPLMEVKIETKTENVTIDIEPQVIQPSDIPSTSNNIIINEINLYDDEPTVRDIPFDVYDDSIKLEPQNPKNKNYHSINTNEDNLNNINLYESTPETRKTFFQKIKEICEETIRLIKTFISGIFSLIWAIIGGTITGIFVFFRNLYFNMLCSCVKFMFRRNKKTTSEKLLNNVKENIWDVNNMLITKPLNNLV